MFCAMMSPNKSKKGAVAIRDSSPEPGPSCSKRGKRSKMSSDDEEDSVPKSKKAAPSKYVSKSKRSPGFAAHNKPAELFRKDLISAMKLPDSEPLQEGSYFLISDPWRQEWEKGVQVPVNMKEILQTDVREIREKSKTGDFKIPHKMLHERVDSVYKKGLHELTGMQQLSEQLVRYDLDDLDVCWLDEVNFKRREMGKNPKAELSVKVAKGRQIPSNLLSFFETWTELTSLIQINEWNMERVMEALENQCHEKMTDVMKTEEGMGIEYDEDIVCDVCCSPDSEDTNEMVFCDGCDVCIHQACYGIQSIPEGSWLCRTCALGIKPSCMLCPKMGGAMKSTKSGTKWAHVSCALWIPEVSIGIPEKMEPITKISNIPPSRWALLCCLCKERVGACIQCSVKTCKTAFHVTCGFSNSLEMKTVLDETDEKDGVKLKAYCPKHTKKLERGNSESDTDSLRKESPPNPKKEMTQQERENLRAQKLKGLEEDFHNLVDVSEVCETLQLEKEIVELIFVYWKLKRKCNWDKPLLTPKTEEADILEKQQEDSLVARMKMFVHLRQDLERVRNLCYMIGKREKTKRQFFRSKEYVFTSMVRVLLDKSLHLSNADVDDIVHNYHFDSIYDDYGLSVQHLPPEPSRDEGHPSEVEMKEEKGDGMWGEDEKGNAGDGQQQKERAVEEGHAEEPPGAEEEEIEEDPSEVLPPGERWSGEFVRSGFFMRRRPKKWMAGKGKKRKLPLVVASPESCAPVVAVKPEKATLDDDNVFTSNDESDEDKEKLAAVVKAIVDKSDDDSDLPQPVIPRLLVKSPRSKSLAVHHHRHKKRHRGRKPWHMKEAYDHDLRLSSSDDDDMKVEPILERRKESSVTRENTVEDDHVLDEVRYDDSLRTSQQHVVVDVEGDDGGPTVVETFPSANGTQSVCRSKESDSIQTVSDSSKKKSDRSVQQLFDLVRKESEPPKTLHHSERTTSSTDKVQCATKSGDTKPKSNKAKPSDSVKKCESVKEKREGMATLTPVPVMVENRVKSDGSNQSTYESKESTHRRKSGKSRLKSYCAKVDIEDTKICAEDTSRKSERVEKKQEKAEGKRKERESRHRHHESSTTSRRSRRDDRKLGHSEDFVSSMSQPVQITSVTEEADTSRPESPQKLDNKEEFSPSKFGSVHRLSHFDESSSVRKYKLKDEIPSSDCKTLRKAVVCEQSGRKDSELFEQEAGSISLSSGLRDRQRTKKTKDSIDKMKSKVKDAPEPSRSLVTASGSRRTGSCSGHSGEWSNIFEKMERSTSSSSGHSSERSNIFESMERHCRESSLDMRIKNDDLKLTEPLKSQSPILDWPSKVEFHFGASEESMKMSQSSDHWFAGGPFRNSSHVEENLKTSDVAHSSSNPLLDKPLKTIVDKTEASGMSESVEESSDLHLGSSAVCGEGDKDSETPSLPDEDVPMLPSGEGLCVPSDDALCLLQGDAAALPDEAPSVPDDVPCLPKVDDLSLPSEDVPCLPSDDVPCLPNENVPCLPDDDVPCLPNDDVPCLPSDDVPCLPNDDVLCLPSDDVPCLPSDDALLLSSEDVPSPPSESVHSPLSMDAPSLSSKLVPCVDDKNLENKLQFEGEGPAATESEPQPDSEQVDGNESDMQVETEGVNHVESYLQVASKADSGIDSSVLVEMEEVNEVERDVQVEDEGVNDIESDMQEGPEMKGVDSNLQVGGEVVNSVQSHLPVKGEEASCASAQSADDHLLVSPVALTADHADAALSSDLLEESQLTSAASTADETNVVDALEITHQQSEEAGFPHPGRRQSDSSSRHQQSEEAGFPHPGRRQSDSSSRHQQSEEAGFPHSGRRQSDSSSRHQQSEEAGFPHPGRHESDSSSRQHRKRSHKELKEKDNNTLVQAHSLSQKNMSPSQEMSCRGDVLNSKDKPLRRSSLRVEERHENVDSSVARVRQRRKSSHEARLKLSKVLAARDSSSDDDFEPRQPVVASLIRRPRHDRHSKKLELKCAQNISSEELSEGEDSDEDSVGEKRRSERRRSHHWDTREQFLQKDVLGKSASRTHTDSLQPDLNKLLSPSDLIVEDVLVKRVEDSLLRRYKHNHHNSHANGVVEDKQKVTLVGRDSKRKSKALITKDSSKRLRSSGDGDTPLTKPLSKTRVLNEITPERSGNFQTNLFGAHYIPRGSLSGYKIPKKSSSQSAVPPSSSSPQQVTPTSVEPFCGGGEFSSFKSLATAGPFYMHENSLRKSVHASDTAGDFEASSTVNSDQFEGRLLTTDTCRGYRSGSPASEGSVVLARQSDSRESTPRRFTRSQLADELVENSPSSQGAGASGSIKIKLRDSWLKGSNFTS